MIKKGIAMKTIVTALLSSLIISFSSLASAAPTTHPTEPDPDPTIASMDQEGTLKGARAKIKNMTPEQRKALMINARKKWDSLPDAEKQAFRDKNKERVEKIKAHMEKRHEEMMQNNGEKLYIRIYAIEQMK